MNPDSGARPLKGKKEAASEKRNSGEGPLLSAGCIGGQVGRHVAVVVHKLPAIHPGAADGCVKLLALCKNTLKTMIEPFICLLRNATWCTNATMCSLRNAFVHVRVAASRKTGEEQAHAEMQWTG